MQTSQEDRSMTHVDHHTPRTRSRSGRKQLEARTLDDILLQRAAESMLKRWGRWRRTGSYKLGTSGRNMLDRIMKKEILGSGNSKSGFDPTTVNRIFIIEDYDSERIDDIFKRLMVEHRVSMQCLFYRYVWELNDGAIARQLALSRYHVRLNLATGKNLIGMHRSLANCDRSW